MQFELKNTEAGRPRRFNYAPLRGSKPTKINIPGEIMRTLRLLREGMSKATKQSPSLLQLQHNYVAVLIFIKLAVDGRREK
jgi:hypothetical protein